MNPSIVPVDARVEITVHLSAGRNERYERLMPEHLRSSTTHGVQYGEVRTVVFRPGTPTAVEYIARRRKDGTVNANASANEVAVGDVPTQVRASARRALIQAAGLASDL